MSDRAASRAMALTALGAALATMLSCAAPARALVNPQLQPCHLVERHLAVIGGTIARIDEDKGTVAFRVTDVCVGNFAPKEVTVQVPKDAQKADEFFDDAVEGRTVVAFVGKSRKGHERDGLLYAAHQWHEIEVLDAAGPAAWKWIRPLGDEMVGTFNGAAEQLLALMKDVAERRDFFPAYPTVKFKEVPQVDTFAGPVRGVALYDIDGDGRPDLYACSDGGNRAYLQTGPLKFENRTAALGLEGVRSASVSFADANADGRPDLLADGALYLQGETGFAASPLLPPQAARDVKGSAFVELNGDGYPDVLISRTKGGLAVYLNPGAKGGAFADATAAAGLDRPECGAGGTGFFAPGDWNGDGRTDLYYGVGNGLLLVQDEKGRFSPVAHKLNLDLRTATRREVGLAGGGCFAPLGRADALDLVLAADVHLMIAANRAGVPTNVTGDGNETRLCRVSQLATLAEDLNMDGYVDLFTLTREADAAPILHENRGYGSYMSSELYATNYDAFPGKAFTAGAWGAAAGDLDGDGANDLLLGGADGGLRVALSDLWTHDLRQPAEHPTPLMQKLQQTRILSVHVKGRIGVLGATVVLSEKARPAAGRAGAPAAPERAGGPAAAGRIVARRQIGSQVLTGCRGPDAVNLAVREPGAYTLTVRFSDGATRTWPVDLTGDKHVTLTAGRE